MPRLALSIALLLVSCEATAVSGNPCTHASDCSAGLVCRFGACRTECRESRDCPIGAECLPDETGGACALVTDRCRVDDDCTAPLVCGADGECRAACLSNDDCTDDGACVLEGRLVCVAREPVAPSPCFVEGEGSFARGLDEWCVETSEGVDPSVISVAPTNDAAIVDLGNAPIGAWARLTQETPFRPTDHWTYDLGEIAIEGGVMITAIELIGDDGALLGRVGIQTGGGDCRETGRPTGRCEAAQGTEIQSFGVGGAAAIPFANVDIHRVARVRRVFEVARTRTGTTRAVLEHVSLYTLACGLAWWREDDHRVSLDLDDPRALPGGASLTSETSPLRLFDIGICGQAMAIDGGTAIDVAITPMDGPRTISLFWHATRTGSPFEGAALVREVDGDVELVVDGNTLTARAGRCGSTPALEVLDDTVLGPVDRRWQEAQVFVDRTAGTLCLARSGHLVGCATSPACPLGPSTATALRFGELTASLGGDALGLDEVRVDDADVMPRAPSERSGACHLDRTCFDYDRDGVRDVGSGECVAPSECTTIALCPRGATDPAPGRCSAEPVRMPCGYDARDAGSGRCAQSVAFCGTGVCPNWYTRCDESVAPDFAACPP